MKYYEYTTPVSIVQSAVHPEVMGLSPGRPVGHITFVEIDYEIISKAFISLPLIPEWQLSVTGGTMCTEYWLID